MYPYTALRGCNICRYKTNIERFLKVFPLPQRRRLPEHELVQTLVSPQQLQSPNQLLTTSPKVKALNEARI